MLGLKRFVLATFFMVVSCSYHVGDSRSSNETLRVFVPVLENVSARPVDLNELTSSFRETLEAIKGVMVVNSRKDADVVVLGRIVKYDRTYGPTAYKGTVTTAAAGGLRENSLSASTARINIGIDIEKATPQGARISFSSFNESDLYELSDRLTLADGSAATPQIHNSREALLVKKLSDRIFRRVRAQIVDDF